MTFAEKIHEKDNFLIGSCSKFYLNFKENLMTLESPR